MNSIEQTIKNLPKEKTESIKFNLEYSYFYLNINIDKSFEIFKKFIFNKNMNNTFKSFYERYVESFISRIFELDRLIYVIKFFFNKILASRFNKIH